MTFKIDLEKAVKEIKRLETKKVSGVPKTKGFLAKQKAKRVLIQLPDGLKPRAAEIVNYLEKETKCRCFIWSGSCFGACDLPPDIKDIDLCLQFGHSAWPFYKKGNVKNTRRR